MQKMQPERWQQIEEIYHAALECEPEERATFLAEACSGDIALRREVESLLRFDERAEQFIEAPAFKVAAQLKAEEKAQSLIGRQLGPYQILSMLGAGGMGEVYRARDTRLDREVAVKVLPTHLAQNPEALMRFNREAKAVAALSHPNILAIHDVGAERGIHFAVMELLEGETLRSCLARSPLPWRKAVEIGAAITDGLQAAHAKGIIHRDLKPENIFLTGESQVKILDFGIARVKQVIAAQATTYGTTKPGTTTPGTVIGTVGYMSPEQLRGEEADAPSDIFSFGCVVYEMVTGRRAFVRQTTAETIAAILTDNPPTLSTTGKEFPVELERVISRCLEKQPRDRFQSARDLASDLRTMLSGSRTEQAGLGRAGSVFILARPTLRVTAALIAALAMAFAFTVYYFWPKQAVPQPPIRSIAVLPFKPLVADSRDESLEMGMADTLITRLSSLRQIMVRPMSAVRKYAGLEQDSVAAGREQRVDAVLDGSIQKSGERIRVTVRLVSVGDGKQLWADQFDERFTDIFAIQDSISQRLIGSLAAKLVGEERELLTKHHTDNTEAYQHYVKGRYSLLKPTEEGAKNAIEQFRQALVKDPRYALAHVGLADSYITLGGWGLMPGKEAYPKAKEAATRALEMDEKLGEAHVALATVTGDYYWDWPEAARRWRLAIDLNPNYAPMRSGYSWYLTQVGRFDEAIREAKRALELDPLSLDSNNNLALVFLLSRQYDKAVQQSRMTAELDPSYHPAHVILGAAYLHKKMYNEAISELQKARAVAGRSPDMTGLLGYAYAVAGKRSEAEKILEELNHVSKQQYVSPSNKALIYIGLGEKDLAFEWLEKVYEDRTWLMGFLKVNPVFDSLRPDPRFQDLLRRVGLTP